MKKQITTVYTKTLNLSDYLLCSHDGINGFARESMLNKQEAYLYTPEEHAAVQGYKEALEKIANEPFRYRWEGSPKQTPKQIAQAALSKAEDKGEGVRTIDGCLTCVHNIDTFEGNSFCIHNCNKGSMYELYVCKVQPSRTTKPTNSLDELERWANEDGSDFITIDDIRRKIKSLKIINY